MDKFKNIILKIVKPPAIVKAFLFIISGISLVFTIVSGKSFIAVPFVSFVFFISFRLCFILMSMYTTNIKRSNIPVSLEK